jgi:hypothetical protein
MTVDIIYDEPFSLAFLSAKAALILPLYRPLTSIERWKSMVDTKKIMSNLSTFRQVPRPKIGDGLCAI